MQRIEIALNKSKLVALNLGSFAFVAVGTVMILRHYDSLTLKVLAVKTAGIAGCIFFGAIAVFTALKLFDKKPGLVVDATGILDNSSSVAAGFIPWADVRGLREILVRNQKFLMIDVIDSEKYVSRSNAFTRMLVVANTKYYGSPVAISSVALSIDFEQLKAMIAQGIDLRRPSD